MQTEANRENVAVKVAFYGIVATLAAVGAGAAAQRFVEGLKVTALSSTMTWGLWIAFYIFFVGLSAGSFLLSTMIYVFNMRGLERVGRLALLTAVLALVGALIFVGMDLGHPERFWRIVANWHGTSVMAIEFALYLFYIALMLVELYFLMRLDLAAAASKGGVRGGVARLLSFGFRLPATAEGSSTAEGTAMKVAKVCGIIGIPTAIGVHGGTGAIFAVSIARPYWNSGLFPVMFVVSALASGSALVTLLYALLGRRDDRFLPTLRSAANLMILFIAIDALLVVADFTAGFYQRGTEASSTLGELALGHYSLIFWLGEVGLGLLVPVLLVALGGRSAFWMGAAGFSMLMGILAVRFDIVVPAYLNPVLPGLNLAYQDPRFVYQYSPSGSEWLISVGLVAFLALVLALALDLLPMGREISPIGGRRR
ncbi:MAG: polysulfide reductase NrfD [Bacteroidetes bacterium]|nr:polysulfide reductase NrfD [Bacteroidota bacterium]